MRTECLIALIILATAGASVQAETVDCTPITSLPAVISTQGIYCLTGNLDTAQTSGAAITISSNNVTLDLNGWKVGGQSAGTGTTANGIYSTANNVTVKNGIVRGFYVGVHLAGRGARVQGITADQNTSVGIFVSGQGNLVQDNQVVDTGGSTALANVNVSGIYATGVGSLIRDNLVSGLKATGNGYEVGIYFDAGADQSGALSNVVSDTARPPAIVASAGIYMYGTSAVAVSSNIVTNFTYCVEYAYSSTGTYSRNTAISCDVGYAGTGTAGNGND